METQSPIVAGAGLCCLDYIIVSPQVKWGDTALVSEYMVQGGGLVGTAMVACARLGARCHLLSMLGDDKVGNEIVDELIEEGIPDSNVHRIKGAVSPVGLIHVDENSGERTIFHRPGSNLNCRPDQFPLDNAREWNALLVDDIYLDLSIAAARAARAHKVPVVADLIPNETDAVLVKMVDALITPRHYTKQIGCEYDLDLALDAIHKLGPSTAVITLGADGWVYSDSQGHGRGEAFKVDAVDTTGAGDTFHGAFTYALAMGWNTARCCEFAAAVAAIKCTKRGGRTGLPCLSEVMDFLGHHRNLDHTG